MLGKSYHFSWRGFTFSVHIIFWVKALSKLRLGVEFSGDTDAKCVVLGMSNLGEIRVSHNTSCGFPWENYLLS